MSHILHLAILFFLVSCSTNQSGPVIDSDLNVVSFEKESKSGSTPKISSEEQNIISVGPGVVDSNLNSSPSRKVIGLFLGPGINRTIGHAVAVRAIFEKGIKFNMISGTGLGAVVAAYLAMGHTPEVIEWKFHKFFLKIKNKRPFSAEWLDQVNKSLLGDFENLQIQSTKLTLIIPVYNYSEGKIEYARRGSLREKLLQNLQLEKSKGKYISVLTKSPISFQNLRGFGMQIIIAIDALSEKVNFIKKEDFLIGIFGKLASAKPTTEPDITYKLPSSNFSLDSIDELPEYLRETYLFMEIKSKELMVKYKEMSFE